MFEQAKLLGHTERRIIIETRLGRRIDNLVELPPGERERRQFQLLMTRFGKHWELRKPASGGYNCAGHIWASRRAAILNPADWTLILEDDGYRLLNTLEGPKAGDLIIYIDEPSNEMLHVAEVVELLQGITDQSRRICRVLSKWNSTSGEVLHLENDVPFGKQGFQVRNEYWTDRPPVGRGEQL